jgi:hypothetical protein
MRAHSAGPLLPLGAVAGSAAAVVALGRLGSGPMSAPPIHSWTALTRWYDSTAPELALIATLRSVALLLGGWLFVASALQVLGALPGLRPVGRLADCISPRSLQRLGHGLAGLSLTAGLTAVGPSAGIPLVTGGRSAAVVAPHDEPPLPSATDEPGTATLRPIGEADPPPAPRHDEVTVAAGDSFWSIAVDTLTERLGVDPSDRQVVRYWRNLIELNRARLVDPGNADLIFSGQVFQLPPS